MKKAVFVSVLVLFTGFAAAQSFEDEPVMGSEDANVTMVMYEDLQCPFCKRFESDTFPKIESNYVETGELKVVWKDFPMPQIHNWAEDAATTMECVYREGGDETFWSVKDKVFENQDGITESNVKSKIKFWAEEEGLESSAVDSCLENENPLEEVNEDTDEGREAGISGTPGFLINGEKVIGAQPYSRFQQTIENAQEEDSEQEKPSRPEKPPETGEQPVEVDGDLKQRVQELESQIQELRQQVNQLQNAVEKLRNGGEASGNSGEKTEKSSGEKEPEGNSGEKKEGASGNSGGGGGVFGFVGGLLG